MQPQIIFEDEFLLVINKPSGMVVNRAETTREGETVQDWVERKILSDKNLQSHSIVVSQYHSIKTPNEEFLSRAGIVHRLDKETSGLLLIAKTPEAFVNLQAQFKSRQVKKKYLALVHGKVIPEEGEIKAPVGRLPWNRERFGVVPGGREAVTKYKILRYYDTKFTLLELYPQTGRTHQIRVHLKYLGYPIVGDNFYAGRKVSQEDRQFCPRVFLHANFLSFTHPKTKKKLKFISGLPQDLTLVINQLK